MTFQDDQLSPGYNQFDEQRFAEEQPKRHGRRAFARDKARVLHSAGLRRLSAKTQVMSAGADDFPRTRLTHTLEVAQIGRELGDALGCDADLVETACLVHDIGHPPFGHNGEEALHQAALDIGGFEGNAQTFRLLTRLESKTIRDNRSIGLNLTRATLDAATKYPWAFDGKNSKFGFYQEDQEIFDWVRKDITTKDKVFEAQVMDIADDIAYSVHDIEDAIYGNHFNPNSLGAKEEFDEVVKVAKSEYAADLSNDQLSQALNYLISQEWWVKSFTATQVEMAALKNMTSYLIGKFTEEIERSTKLENESSNLTRYNANLVVPSNTRSQIAVLKAVVNLFVMQRKGAAENYAKEQDLILSIVAGLEKNPDKLNTQFKSQFDDATNEKQAKRAVIDQVASLTDSSARRLAQEFVG
ncbi:MAG: deoxyguanosinetriphosphate triphosphohydrolase [Candidatus Nanopelagicales bacterium]|nr:deoxyguanosinetriphosphate triphosphohydrolase [Candidatus Nanopelagicales bacterium]